MTEPRELPFDGGDDLRVIVSGVGDGDAGGEIDVALALDIPDFRVERPVGEHRRLCAEPARRRRLAQGQQFSVRRHHWSPGRTERARKRLLSGTPGALSHPGYP